MEKQIILAIDPGPVESAYVLWDGEHLYDSGLVDNHILLDKIKTIPATKLVIEMVASYGMPVGKSVFETCVAIGRFIERWDVYQYDIGPWEYAYRKDIKMHHCGTMRAKNSNVAAALQDKYAPGIRNKGKGTKKEPGFFYGFHTDIWQAFAVAAYYTEK